MNDVAEHMIDEAYDENARHDERKEQTGSAGPGDLSSPGATAAMPTMHRDKVPVGERFESGDARYGSGAGDTFSPGDIVCGDLDATNADPADAQGGKRYRAHSRVATDLVNEGHGFAVQRFTNPDKPQRCRYCGSNLLTPNELSPCDFADGWEHPDAIGPVDAPARGAGLVEEVEGVRVRRPSTAAPWPLQPPDDRDPFPQHRYADAGLQGWGFFTLARHSSGSLVVDGPSVTDGPCRCTGCRIRTQGVRKRGGQPLVCGADECRRRMAKDQRAEERRRADDRDRKAATAWLVDHPDATDRDVADWAEVRPIRVKEARAALVAAA